MFRNTLFIALFAFTLLTPKVSTAHLAGYVNIGYWLHVASMECGGVYDQHDALKEGWELRCKAIVLEYEGQCANPKGKLVNGTPSDPKIHVLTGSTRNEETFDKVKGNGGRTEASAHLETNGLPLNCKQENYMPLVNEIVVRIFEAIQETHECSNVDCSETEIAWYKKELCSLPLEYNFYNPPPEGTAYNCITIEEEHYN